MAQTAASIGIDVEPSERRAGSPMQTMTSSPTPAPTASTATRWPTSCDGAYQRYGSMTSSLRPVERGVLLRRPDLADDAPEDHGVPIHAVDASTIAMMTSLSASGLADRQIAHARPVRHEHAVAHAGAEPIDGSDTRAACVFDDQQLGAVEAGGVLGTPHRPRRPDRAACARATRPSSCRASRRP